MSQEPGFEGLKYNNESKTVKLYQRFNINIVRLESKNNDPNDGNSIHFHVNFEDKNGYNNTMYSKHFNDNDLNTIKHHAGLPGIKNDAFVNILLYSLSNENNKYPVSYECINRNDRQYLKINIRYSTEFFNVNIIFEIPGNDREIDSVRNELEATKKILSKTQNELKTTQLILNDMQQEFNEYKNSQQLLLTNIQNNIISLKRDISNIKKPQSNQVVPHQQIQKNRRDSEELKYDIKSFPYRDQYGRPCNAHGKTPSGIQILVDGKGRECFRDENGGIQYFRVEMHGKEKWLYYPGSGKRLEY